MKNSRFRQLAAFIIAGAVSGYAAQASAAGFAIIEHSAKGMGNAFAGGGAIAEDASTVWFNPASMTRLPSQMEAAGHVIVPNFEFTDKGSTYSPPLPALPVAGTGTIDGGQEAFVPNFYYIRRLNERFSFGLAVNAPFGLATEYDRNWTGRYHAVESEIINLNINPALAWRANDAVSVGVGVSLNYIDAKLNNAVDFGAVCALNLVACGGLGGNDGFSENEADDISYGFNLGIFYEHSDRTRFSVAYRSQINHKLEGDADFTVPATVPAPIAASFSDGGIKVGASLPDSLSFSAFHMVTPKIGIMADATWTGWSDIPELLIVYDDPTTLGDGNADEPLGWEDVWRLSIGLNYYQSDRLTLRTGVAYDQSPTPSATLRTPRLPDNDRIWVAVGASYEISDKLSVDFGYAHLFINDTNIARTNSTFATLIGSYESDADLISLGINYIFD